MKDKEIINICLSKNNWETILALLDITISKIKDEEDKEELRNIYDNTKYQIKKQI